MNQNPSHSDPAPPRGDQRRFLRLYSQHQRRLYAHIFTLIPKGSKNIVVAGRCVSSDRLANSGLRVQAPCMAMGQAAACAAAIAAKDGTTPGKVSLAKLHALLKEHGAIIPQTS